MHVVLVGPGALGCLLASLLAEEESVNHRVTLLDHNPTRAEALSAEGIRYRYQEDCRTVAVHGSASPAALDRADVVILCVKSYDIRSCLHFCRPLINDSNLLLFLQNGIGHLDIPETRRRSCAFGTTTEGATLLGPGYVRHAGRGLTRLGFLSPASPLQKELLRRTAALFNRSGIKTEIGEDILSHLWTKLLINCGINGLTAILGCTNGELLDSRETMIRMENLVGEAREVAWARAIHIPEDILERTLEVCRKTRDNISSMLQDVRSCRRTEIDAINGAVVALGQKLGIATPENTRLVQEIKELELSFLNR